MKKIASASKLDSLLPGNGGKSEGIGDLLHEIEMFQGLPPDELASVFDVAEVRTYPAGSLIFMPGQEHGEKIYALKQGLVRQYRLTPGGKRLITRLISPGSVFGVRVLLGRVIQEDFTEAVEDSTVYIMTGEQVLDLLKRRPELTLKFLEMVYKRLQLLEERLVAAAYNPVRTRLAYFLLNNAELSTGVVSKLSHEDIGNIIGAVRQTITETLGELKKQGVIEIEHKRIRIINRNKLERILNGVES